MMALLRLHKVLGGSLACLYHQLEVPPGRAPGGMYSGPWAMEAVRRYEHLWLPLLAAVGKDDAAAAAGLVPPLDVAFAWLVHRLDPVHYEKYCRTSFGRPVDPNALQARSA
jgi:hypothetical protein